MKIGQKVILSYVGIALFVGILVGYVSENISRNALKDLLQKEPLVFTARTVKSLDRFMDRLIKEFSLSTNNYMIQRTVLDSNKRFETLKNIQTHLQQKEKEWVSAPKEKASPLANELMNNSLSNKLKNMMQSYADTYEVELFGEALITNKYGANLAQTVKTRDYRQDDKEWWQVAKKEGLFVGDVKPEVSEEVTQVFGPTIAVRINDSNGNFIGVMKIIVNMDTLSRYIKENIAEKYKDVDFDLIDKEGKIIYSTLEYKLFDEFRFIKDIKEEKGSFIVKETKDALEKSHIFVYSRSKGYKNFKGFGWVCVIGLDAQEVMAPLAELRKDILMVSLVVTIGAIFFGLFISRAVSGPLNKLTRAMNEISKGNFEVELPGKAMEVKGEIGDLARSFSRMVAALKFFKAGEAEEEGGEEEK